MASTVSVPDDGVTPAENTVPPADAPALTLVEPTPPVDMTADKAVAAVLGESEQRPTMQSSVAMAISTNPDSEAEARRVAARTGVPVQTVFAQPEEMKRKATLDEMDFDNYSALYPTSALALSDVELAKIAHDDTQNMGFTENVLRGMGARAVNIAAGLARTGYTVDKAAVSLVAPDLVDYADSLEGLPGSTNLRAAENVTFGYSPRTTVEDLKARPLSSFLPFALEQGLISTADMAAAVFVPGVYFAAETGEFGQNRAQNDQRAEATLGDFMKVAPAAVVNTLWERFGAKGIVSVGDAERTIKAIAAGAGKAALKEGATEAGQNAAQYAAETIGTKKGFQTGEFVEQAVIGAVAGAPFGGGAHVAVAGAKNAAERISNRVRSAAHAEQDARDFEKLNALAAESKLKARDPLAFQNFVEQVAQSEGAIENVYIDPRALAQAGVSLEQLAVASPSIAEQARVALEIGGDIKIPVSEYASHLAGTELGQAMVDHLKTNPLGMSRAEAKEFMQSHVDQFKVDVEKAMTEQTGDNAFQQSTDVVHEDIVKKLATANRFTNDVNQQYAMMLSNFYKVQAARIGVAPEALYAQHPVNIQSTLDPGVTLDQSTPSLEPALRNSLSDLIKTDLSIPNKVDFLERAAAGKLTPGERRRLPNDVVRAADSLHEYRQSRELQQNEDISRGSFNPDTNTITLLRGADLSTFLHESGHFFLEIMNKLATDPAGPIAIKQDMQAVMDWLGVKDLAEWNAHDLEWQREKHEQFARGFEAYLFEGKSPSIEMRGVFQRFRAWLLNVYRNIKNLNVELSDEVRGVFDRMLATNEQIKETEIARSFEPMFKDAATAGMNEAEWRQYQELGIQATQDATAILEARSMRDMKWLANAKSRVLKDLQREAAGRRREVRDQVTKEIMNEPVNQAQQFLTKGEINGEKVEDAAKLRASDIPEGTKLPRGMTAEEGLAPDAVAEMFGFTSGDELLKALATNENPKTRIAAFTDQRMLEKYGDLTNPEIMAQAADEAVHNEVRTRFVATELNALQRATGGRKILIEAAKRFADGMIDRSRVRDILPGRYSAAEARAARAADKALRAGDLNAAAVEKRNQLIQNYASRAAHAALAETEKALRYFKKFDREGARENIDSDYLDQIDTLLERFDLSKGTTLKEIDRRKSLLDWKNAQEDLGIEPEIPAELLNESLRKSYKEMTIEELRGLRDTVKQIEHLGKLKNKLLTAKDDRDFKTTVDAMVESINTNAGGRTVDNRTRASKAGQAMRLFKGYVAQHRKVASLARELDGVKDGGPVWDTLIRTMNDAGNMEAGAREKASKQLAKLIKPLLAGEKMGGKGRYFESIGKSLNREERIGMALNTGNLGNFQRLLDGEGWVAEQIRPILDSLTKDDWDFVQNIWDFFESYRPEIGAKEKRVYGKQPDWIEPNPVQTRFGEYRGGYYPIKYDTRRSIAAEQHSDAEFAKQQMKGAYTSATTRRSFTKTRADEVKGRPLLYSMDGLYNGVNEIIHDLSWHEWLIDANRLLRNRALDGAIRNGYGADVVRQFKDAVRDIAGGEMPTGTSFEKAIGDLRAGAIVAGLGVNIVNSIINLTGITNSVVRIGPKWMAMGVAKWTENPRELAREVHSKSEFMRLRSKTMLREINEIQSQVRGKSRVRSVADTMMFAPMTFTQMAVDLPSWYGAYQKALTNGVPEEKAVALADQAVLDAQSGGQVKDLAAIQRGGPIMKLFTTFYGYFNASYNLGVERTKATNFKDPLSVMKLGADYLMLYTVPAVIGGLIKTALMGKDDDWEPEKLASTLANEQLSYLMGLMIGLREVTSAVQTVAGVNPYTASYGGPAGLRFFQELTNLATQIHQGEADDALRKSAINVLGIFFKLPASQINRTIGGVEAMIDGDTENPLAVVAGPPRK